MKKSMKLLRMSIITFAMTVAFIMGVLPLDGFATVAQAAETIYSGFTVDGGSGGFSGENFDETHNGLVDGKANTKWCAEDTHKSIPSGESGACYWVDFHYVSAIQVDRYSLTTGGDNSSNYGRNPESWVLKAKTDQNGEWSVIATVNNDKTMKDEDNTTYDFELDAPGTYQYFRFMISENRGAANGCMQLSELTFSYREKYTISFEKGDDGASGTIDTVTRPYGEAYSLPTCTFDAPTNKTFKEWSVKIGDAEAVGKQPNDIIEVTANTTVTAVWSDALSGSGTQDDPYNISSEDDWKIFVGSVSFGNDYSGKTVVLKDDITVTRMVGNTDHKFKGTFNGGGHTLTFNAMATAEGCAPFFAIDGATIRCLKVAGTINTGKKCAAGIAFQSYGDCIIRNCRSSVVITSTVNGDGTHAGLVAVQEDGSLGITDCLFDGSITGSNTTNCGGFVGWRKGTLIFTNCMMAGTMGISQTDGSDIFNRNGSSTLTNCYYDGGKSYGSITAQGTSTTDTGETLREKLGSSWEVSGDKVVPIMDAKNLALAIISGVDDRYFRTGDEIKPEPVVTTLDGVVLTKDTDYTVEWSGDGKTDGTYTITIKGTGSYKGSQTVSYDVSCVPLWLNIDAGKHPEEDGYYYVNIPSNGTVEYEIPDGFEKQFQVRYTHGGGTESGTITLAVPSGRKMIYSGEWSGSDHIVDCSYSIKEGNTTKYSGNNNATINTTTTANNTLTITCKHNGTLGTLTLNVMMKPDPIRVENLNEFYVYTGSNITVNPTVSDADNNTTLNAGTDYDITFSPETVKDKGVYTATITGKDAYDFAKTFKFLVGTLEYVDADGVTQTKAQNELTLLNTRNDLPSTLSGWYLVADNITFSDTVKVSGTANLVLADGTTMNANHIRVNSGNTLNIYGQTGNSGSLNVSPSGLMDNDAGIGASEGSNCGTITINGGAITAKGGDHAAGIGGTQNLSGGTITINGGVVNATSGGLYAAAIGGGYNGGAAVTINGGLVTATARNPYSYGIGSGNGNTSSTISLGWKKTSDFIYASNYNGTVTFQDGKLFTFDDGTTGATTSNINGKKIIPATEISESNIASAEVTGLKEYYNPSDTGIDLDYQVISYRGQNLTKGQDYTETITNDGGTTVEAATGTGTYTLTLTGINPYSGTKTLTFTVLGDTGNLGGYSFTRVIDDDDNICYAISSETDLRNLSAYVNAGNNCDGIRFRQTENITMTGGPFEPIASVYNSSNYTSAKAFQGTYDGGGHSIKGLTIYKPSDRYVGLFAVIAGGTVENLVILDPNITGESYVGAISGEAGGSYVNTLEIINEGRLFYIRNCRVVNPTITATDTGAIVGHIWNASLQDQISDCYFYTNSDMGYAGDAGTNSFTNVERVYKITVTDCTASGTPAISADGTDYYKEGASVTLSHGDPATGYHFAGYTASAGTLNGATLTMPDQDVTISPTWARNTYTVSFAKNATDTTGTMQAQSFTYDETQSLTANSFSRAVTVTFNYNGATGGNSDAGRTANATFNGWATSAAGTAVYTDGQSVKNLTAVNGATVDLYAKWTDGSITLPTPTKANHTFGGWYSDSGFQTKVGDGGASYTPDGAVTLYAKWKAAISPVVGITGWTYGETAHSPSVTAVSNPGNGAVTYQYKVKGANDSTYSGTVPTGAGEYTVQATVAETDNYTGGVATADFTISRKPVTITGLSAANKTYDGNSSASAQGTPLINGAKSGDDVGVAAGTASFADKNVGTGKTVTFSGYSLTGTAADNYELSGQPESRTADIMAKSVTITGLAAADKTYDGTTTATVVCSGATFTGKIEGDTLSVSGVTGTFADKDVANGKIVTLNYGNAVLGGTDAGNYTIAGAGNQDVASAAIAKKTAPAVSEISRTYLYSAGGQESIDIAALLPADCGTATYTVTKSGDVTYSADPAVTDGILTYTVRSGAVNDIGTITVKAETLNYTDITITVNVKLADQKPVELKDGASVELNNSSTLTYGEALSTLTFKTNTAVFVEQGNTSNVIAGTLEWKTPTAVPAAGTTSATWVFTPADAAYAAFEGTVAITVNKATPLVMTAPTATAITYGQTLADSTFSDGLVKVGETDVDGSFDWKTGTAKPTVADSGETLYDVVFTPSDTTNYETAECKVKITVNKANPTVTAPTAKTGLGYTGIAQTLVTQGSTNGGTLQYALGENKTTAPTSGWSDKVPTGIKAGTYYVWYKVVEDENYNGSTPGCVEATIAKKATETRTIVDVKVQAGENQAASLNLKIYVGDNITVKENGIQTTGPLSITGVSMATDKSTLHFVTDSTHGTEGNITLTLESDNYSEYELTVPVTAYNKTAEVKLDETSTPGTSVEGVAVGGLDDYADSQTGDTVKVEMNVRTEGEPSNQTVKNGIESKIALVFPGLGGEVEKEYLDISVTKSVNGETANPVDDVGRVLEIAIKYDLSGKFNPVVIREHKGSIVAFTALESKPGSNYKDGTFYVDADTGTIYIYTEFFSTYSFAYAKTVSYTVKFDAQGGTSVDPVVVKSGGVINPLPEPTRSGYSFNGWYNGSTKWTTGTAVTGNMTLTASWTRNGGGGTGGGSGGGGGGTPTPTTYTVSFDMGGHGTAISSQTIESGKTVTKPTDPTADGFVFTGWYTSSACLESELFDFATPVTKNITLYAGWREAKKFSVSFNMSGKEATDVPETQLVEEGRCASEPAVSPKAEGFKFAGWYAEAECETLFDFTAPIKADTVVYAKWIDEKAESFTVTFDLNGKPGTAPSPQIVEKDGTAEAPAAPTAEGFSFTGWYTEKECISLYDFATPVTADLTLYAGWEEKPESEPDPVIIEDGAEWNLYEDASVHEYKISGIDVSGTVENSNAKSKEYFDAKLSGAVISVKVSGDRKKAASNATLEFDLGSAGILEYALPVSYVKPSFKLSSTTATIKKDTETVLKTTLLVKNADGSYEPYDMADVSVSGNGLGTVTKAADGSIEIRTSAAGKGKISIVKESWDGAKPVSLAYTVKGSKKDVLSVDLQGLKTVVVNSNAKGQSFSFDVTLNGAAVSAPAEEATDVAEASEAATPTVTIADKKNTGLATISTDGQLVIAYKEGVKNGSYTITLRAGEAKTNVKIKVSGKALDKALTAKVLRKYDVVTKESMIVAPKLKDLNGTIEAVSVSENGFSAKLNAAGNIVIDYSGDKYDAKNLNIGTLTLTLTISGVEEPVKLTLNKVKAKKTTPKAKAEIVTVSVNAAETDGSVIGTAKIASTYKSASGAIRSIRPVKAEIVGSPKGVEAKVNASNFSRIDILSISKKIVSFKVKLTYPGGVTKTVTVKVKKK